jgi:hypothetical protein
VQRAYSGGVGKFLLVVALFAAIVYAAFWLIERRRGATPAPRPTQFPRPTRRAVAPDDDEEFLRELERRRRRASREQNGKKNPDDNGDPDQGHPGPE